MIRKDTLFIVDGSGEYLDTQRGILRALDDQTSVIQVLCPFDLDTVVKVTYLILGAENDTVTQFIPSTTLKGSDVLDSSHTDYQTVADWNVFEIEVSQRALTKISKYKAGHVKVSFSFRERYAPVSALVYQEDTFGLYNDLPASSTTAGDYYICDRYNYTSAVASLTFTKGDYAVWSGTAWANPKQNTLIANTSTLTLTVSAAMTAAVATDLDEDDEFLAEFVSVEADVNQHTIDIAAIEAGTQDITYDNSGGDLAAVTVETALDELSNEKVDKVTDKSLVLDTEITKLVALDNQAELDAKYDLKVDKITTILGLDLQNNIELIEFKTALGNATTVLDGLMSSEDKAYLDSLVALLGVDDLDHVVDTLGEVLAIFENYPEGTDIVSALAGKVDKATGKSLVLDTEISKLADLDTQAETDALLYEKVDKVTGSSLIPTTKITKLDGIETGAEVNIIEQININDIAQSPIDRVVNVTVPTKTSDLTNDGDGDSAFVTADELGEAGYGDMTEAEYATNGETGVVDKAKVAEALEASSPYELDTVFDNRISAGMDLEIQDSMVSNAKVSSIKGMTVENLVTNGDFATGDTTGWTILGTVVSSNVNDNILSITSTTGAGFTSNEFSVASGDKVYYSVRGKTTNELKIVLYQIDSSVPEIVITSSSFVTSSSIHTVATGTSNGKIYLRNIDGTSEVAYVQALNLTAIFGAGNEPSTTAEVEAYLTGEYIDSKQSVQATAISSVSENMLPKLPEMPDTIDEAIYDGYALDDFVGVDTTVVKASTTWAIDYVLSTTHMFKKDLSSLGYKLMTSNDDIANITLKIGDTVFNNVALNTSYNTNTENLISIKTGGLLYIRVNKTTYPDTASFEAYLQANDVTFGYELDTAPMILSETNLKLFIQYTDYLTNGTAITKLYMSNLPIVPSCKLNVGYNGTPTDITLEYLTQDKTVISSESKTTFSGSTEKYANFTVPALTKLLNVYITPTATINQEFIRNTNAFMKFTEINSVSVGNTNATTYSEYKSDTLTLPAYTLKSVYDSEFVYDEIDLINQWHIKRVDDDYTVLATPVFTALDTDNDYVAHNFGLEHIELSSPIIPNTIIEYPIDVVSQTNTNTENIAIHEKRILANENDITTLQGLISDKVIIMSATEWAVPYVQVTGEVYGVYDESTFVITWYYGQAT